MGLSCSVAFSRETTHKVYVQDKLKDQGSKVWELLGADGYLYVCGDAKNMARDVNKAMIGVVKDHSKCTLEDAEALVRSWTESGRYLRDVW